jgi:hypothetical protein
MATSFFFFCFCSYGAMQQSVVIVPALPAFDGALRRELALPSPVLLQTTEADVDKDVLGLPQLFLEGKTLEPGTVGEVVLATALIAILFIPWLPTSWRLRHGGERVDSGTLVPLLPVVLLVFSFLVFCDNKLEANANDKDSRPELCSGNQQK